MPVCSDASVGRKENEDALKVSASELVFPATTDVPQFVSNYESKKHIPFKVVFSTYQSLAVVKESQDKCGFTFDLIICDEAHRTTGAALSGKEKSHFLKIHDVSYIKGDKRLYMTATPKVYSESVKKKAEDNDALLCSMDDEEKFGKEFYRLGFGEAVEKNLLTDYKVIVLTVSESYVQKNYDEKIANNEDIDFYGKIEGIRKALSKKFIIDESGGIESDPLPMKRAVIFTGNIQLSKDLTENITAIENNEGLIPLESKHIDGTMSSEKRNNLLYGLKKEEDKPVCKILTNARCLSEGIDVPSLDAVIFFSPRNSMVDIVQAVGRVMRKSKGKKYGYIILPVVVPGNVSPEEALDKNEKYKVVWQVLQALRSHDDRFYAEINKLEFNRKSDKIIAAHVYGGYEDADNYRETLIVHELELESAYHEWADAIISRIVQKCGDKRYWENWAGDVAGIAKRHIEVINEILRNNENAFKIFKGFLSSLRSDLNEEIKEEDAIEMIAQHLITSPVFEALFSGWSFLDSNPVSKAMNNIIKIFDDGRLTEGVKKLGKFYESVKMRAKDIKTAEGKQRIIIELYDKFFKTAFPKVQEKLGIVYTPVEAVDFIIRLVEYVLNKNFGKSLSDKGVHILDPFTGTGTFITRLLRSGFIRKEDIEYKYKKEIHANEIILLAYYIASVNIEETYHDLSGETGYSPFEGIVLTDTFNLAEEKADPVGENLNQFNLGENRSRAMMQKDANIKVIFGNPPYSVGQRSANDDNANVKYANLENNIRNTYAKYSKANLKNKLYDSYVKAFRWAGDRIGDEGVICFITNGGYIDSAAFNGFRKCLSEEFSEIYCFNLRGNFRSFDKKEGGNIFGNACGTTVAITLLVKNNEWGKKPAEIYYRDIGDYLTREQKLKIINDSNINNMNWEKIIPDEHSDWINRRNDEFDSFTIIGDKKDKKNEKKLFDIYSIGISTNRDAWSYNFDSRILKKNIIKFINNYNSELNKYEAGLIKSEEILRDNTQIKWSSSLENIFKQKKNVIYQPNEIRLSMYRPFCKQYLYYGEKLIERRGQFPLIYPINNFNNLIICTNGIASKKDAMPLIVNAIPDLHILESGTQCFPLYKYTKYETVSSIEKYSEYIDEYGYKKEYAISAYALSQYRARYGADITEEDIFYYVYGILHNEEYRTKYANDLKKSLARIPFVKTAENFRLYSEAGRNLADMHINYENLPRYKLKEETTGAPSYKVVKMKLNKEKGELIYNDTITFKDIPQAAFSYIINGRSPLEWVVDQYCIKKDNDSGIINDPNGWNGDEKYIYNLIKSLVTLSLETQKIINSLPEFDVEK